MYLYFEDVLTDLCICQVIWKRVSCCNWHRKISRFQVSVIMSYAVIKTISSFAQTFKILIIY